MRNFIRDESGQGVLEFMLVLFATVAIVGALKISLKAVTVKLWGMFAKRIAAPCPACDAGQEFDI